MNLQVFLEWFHRLVATGVGLATLALTGLAWWKRQELPRWFPWGMLVAVSLVVFQGVLGGLTVTELLRFDIVTAHLGTGLLFFSTLVVLAMAPWPYAGNSRPSKLPWVGLTAAVLVYLQSLLGGLVASRWALHQCFSGFQLCAVMNSHIIGVFPAAIATLTLVIWALKTSDLHPLLRRVAHIAGAVLALQVGLGIATFRLHLQVEPLTVSHQAVGATLLGTLLVFTVLSFRGVGRSPQPAA
jgi:cytochrome c oxidase assembly protein subunit 15